MATQKITGNEGASLERQAWMAKLKRLRKDPEHWPYHTIGVLEKWGKGRADRNASIPGSIGRPKAPKKAKPSSKI